MLNSNNESLKEEFILEIDSFEKVNSISDVYALAKLFQTLVLLKPMTYPNHPDMGIGIEQYKFEYLDTETIAEIESNIRSQVARYMDTNQIQEIKVEALQNDTTGKKDTIGIMVNLNSDLEHNSFILTISSTGNKTGKVISKIYI